MSGNLFAAIIIGIIILGFIALIYSLVINQPRLRRQLKEQSEQRGWKYTPGKFLMVAKTSASGYLLAPKEIISSSIEGRDEGIRWRVDGVTVFNPQEVYVNNGETGRTVGSNSVYQIIWHTEDVRIEHGSVLLFLKAGGWQHDPSVGGMMKTGLQSVYLNLIYDLMRRTFGMQNTPVPMDDPEFDAKYRVEVSDVGAAQIALTPDVRKFLIEQRPAGILIHLGDNALHIIADDSTLFKKIGKFEKLAALADYGVQLAQVVAASQSAANSQTDVPA